MGELPGELVRGAGGLNLASAVLREDGAHDAPMYLEQFQGECLVSLDQRAEAHHVREHDGGQLAVFGGAFRHPPIEASAAQTSKLPFGFRPWRERPILADSS
jgi:hypothetical protein